MPRDATTVYTDGACSGNPGPGGWAWAVPGGRYRSGFFAHTTNQRMELQAVLDAVRTLEGTLDVVSDSTYVVNCFRDRWWEGWLARGWLNSQKKPVANRDLWEPLIAVYRADPGRVAFRWVKGHSVDPMNDVVDRLAVEAAATQRSREGTGHPPDLGAPDDPGSGNGRHRTAAGAATSGGIAAGRAAPSEPASGGAAGDGDGATERAPRPGTASGGAAGGGESATGGSLRSGTASGGAAGGGESATGGSLRSGTASGGAAGQGRGGTGPASGAGGQAGSATVTAGPKAPAGHLVAVTGLRPAGLGGFGETLQGAAVRRRLAEILTAKQQVDGDLVVMSGMGLGAEQLGVEAAAAVGVPYAAVLAYPDTDRLWPAESRRHFAQLVAGASEVVTLDRRPPDSKQKAGAALARRDAWLAAHAEEAIVVWDQEDPFVGRTVRSFRDRLGEEAVWIVEP